MFRRVYHFERAPSLDQSVVTGIVPWNTHRDPSTFQVLGSCPLFLWLRLEARTGSLETPFNPHREEGEMKGVLVILFLTSVVRGADVTLWMTGHYIVPNPVRWAATEQAGRIFAAIGVRLRWTTHGSVNPGGGVPIQVRFTTDTPGHRGAMVFANLFDPVGVVTVMYDRILFTTERVPEVRPALLAHVLAHEIGHLLMKTNGHSPAGLMKENWSAGDCARMAHRPFAFSPADADMIRLGLGLATR
jgi:hypothetical protein